MKRKTYQASELRAGQTIFVGRINFVPWPPEPIVAAYLVTSHRGHMPAVGEMFPYQLRPELVAHIGQFCPLFRKRRDAQRWVDQELKELVARLVKKTAGVEKSDAAVIPA
ncbi:hypothetical protein [Pseudomonas sp. WS 5027]|uniref:hypothetical protein n=1 Tax=Pseudomonas sp. WS 5027 TaxID=2717483 RepID=UPI0014732891|nr:hypothetical protein [Pseudomonas sp. WS 5027]NMY49135.1 hypothetical protein [Pseudomonas sp. WS 5027]